MKPPADDLTHDPAGLTAHQLAHLRHLLLEARQALMSRRSGQLDEVHTPTDDVQDEGDQAKHNDMQQTLASLAETERLHLDDIDRALAKMEAGTYGLDEDTDEPIGWKRLEAVPWARFTVANQERKERP